MAEGTVDSLNIQLSADADQAVKSLNNLASTLRSINTAFTKDISGMRKFSKEIGTLSASMKSLSKIKFSAPDMSGMTKMLKSLNSMNADGAKKTADGIEKVVNSFNNLGNANFNDSGINKTVNALNRLFKVDTSKFNPNDFVRITDSISKLGNMPDVSSGVNRFVSSLSRLANAGEKTGQSANSVLKLGEQTRLAAQKLQSVGTINDDVNLFVQSIGRLASAGGKTSQTASGLSALSKETIEFFKAMQNAPRVSENTIRMTQALAQLATAGGRVGTATNSVTSAFEKLSRAGTSTMNALKKASSGIVSALQRITGAGKGVNGLTLSLGNLLKTAIGFNIGYGLLNFGKSMFELGSDVTEVENVVDVAFGGMAQSAYDFAKTAQEQFGLSELSALRYSGILMSMFNASGVAQRDAAEMSTTLTGLAGDLASFYNIDQEDAFTKLRSALAGEVEPMRALGVDMTVASMEAYALSQGITESWQSMSQAEKVMLRYNYLMSVTSAQQNDFQRTQASFANQTRLLTLNLQQLAATLGQGLIAAVLPAVTALNKLFAVLQKAAVAVRNFFYVLTGYKGGGSSGIVNDLAGVGDAASGVEDLGSAGSDAAGGLGEAAKAAEELKNATLGIDELNIISPNEPTSTGGTGGSGGGGGAGGVGGTDLGLDDGLLDLGGKDEEKYVSPWAEAIRKAFLAEDWEQLGWEIADGLNAGLRKVYDVISWENVGPTITAFTTAFTDTFNSFAQSLDFDLLGRTIGSGINTVVNTLNQLIDGINWIALGERFAHGFNGLIDEVDWFELGRLISNKFMVVIETLIGFINKIEYSKIGDSIADLINGAISEIDLKKVGKSLGKLASGIFESLAKLFEKIDFGKIAKSIVSGLSEAVKNFDAQFAADAFSNIINGLLIGLTSAIETLMSENTFEDIGQKIVDFICGIDWGSLTWNLVEFFLAFQKAIIDIPNDLAKGIGQGIIDKIFGENSGIKMPEIALPPTSMLGLAAQFDQIKTWAIETASVIGTRFQEGWSITQQAWDNGESFFSGLWQGISYVFSPVAEFFGEKFDSAYNKVTSIWQFVSSWFGEKWTGIKNAFSDVKDWFKNAFKSAYDAVTEVWEGIGDFFKGIANSAIEPIGKLVNGIIDGINWVGDKLGVGKVLNNWDVPQFASGSKGIQKDTFGVVNDQKGATYKELILPPNGKPFIPKGRNVMLPLQKGTKIMPAGQTEELMKLIKIPRFAGGIGDFFGDLWSGIKDFAGDVWSYLSNPGELVKIALDKFVKLGDFFEPWLSIAGGAINKLFDSIVDYVKRLFDKAVPEVNYNPSAGVEQWRQLATKALQMTGQYSESNLNLLLYQMQTESGGNPNAINDWDINAKNGTPSKGLMQVIDPTFKAYAYPGYDKNIYDPLSNILAAIRYTLSRYGSLANGWKGHGYAKGIGQITMADLFGAIPKLAGGGVVMPGQLFVANERGPELLGRYGNRTTVMNNDQVVESVSFGVEKAVERQNAEMTVLLRQILETNQRILAKDTSNYIDGKRVDSLLRRARSNSGYNFRPAGGTV